MLIASTYGGGYWVNYGWELFEHVIDARAASMGNATTAYYFKSPTSSLRNPIFSTISLKEINLTHQSRFAGIVNSDLVSFQLDRNSHSLQFNFLYEGIGQIPDTRFMLLDWGNDGQFGTNDFGEGNGVLDEGERLDIEKIKYLKIFCEENLGKGVIICKDTPGFLEASAQFDFIRSLKEKVEMVDRVLLKPENSRQAASRMLSRIAKEKFEYRN